METILVLGANFAGLTSALEIKRKLKDAAKVIVVSRSQNFLYVPGLIWVPFGRRKLKDITAPLAPILARAGIEFHHNAAEQVLPGENKVRLADGRELNYDYLVIATGWRNAWELVPGLGPDANSHSIVTPTDAEHTYKAFLEYLKNPGPVVIGGVPGTSCVGAAYEYLFNFVHQLKRHNAREGVKITWVSNEPFLGHFGIGGMPGGEKMLKTFLKTQGIDYREQAAIKEVKPDGVLLDTGEFIPSSFTMLIPPFRGVPAMLNSPELVNELGFVKVNDRYQSVTYPNVFAAGMAIAVDNPFAKDGRVPFGVPKTGYPSDEMGKVVAENISRLVQGDTHLHEKKFGEIPAMCIMDAGDKEIIIFADHVFKPRKFQVMLPNLLGDPIKWFLEKYFMTKTRRGWSHLP